MPVTAIISIGYAGAIGLHRPSLPSLYLTPPVTHQLYDHKLNWKPVRSRTEAGKVCRLSARENTKPTSYENFPGEYLDEQDVVTFLDSGQELIPLDPSSYNPATYLWKKIEEIPEERRHHLLSLLNPRLVSRVWKVAGSRYDNPKIAKKSASMLLSNGDCASSVELWKCRTSGAPLPNAWIHSSQKVIFSCSNGETYGRLIGGFPLSGIVNSFFPLYFRVTQLNEVLSTEEPCDLAYEFGDGLLNLPEYPQQFPKPAKHPWPFNDQVVIYLRHVGPGVLVAQAWQEGKELQQVPKKLCSEMLMVKDCSGLSNEN